MPPFPRPAEKQADEFQEIVIKVKRCAKVVKGGKRFSFSALVVVGNRKGSVGLGLGKAKEVPFAVEKAIKEAKRHQAIVPLAGKTIPHRVWGKFGASRVVLRPASEGTGIIAGLAVRAVMELAGIQNVLSKVFGSTNPVNVIKAVFDALSTLRSKADVENQRGVKILRPA